MSVSLDEATPAPTPPLEEQYAGIVRYIQSLEASERVKWHPTLLERAPNVEIDDVRRRRAAQDKTAEDKNDETGAASLADRGLREFSLRLLPRGPASYLHLTTLDVSSNELSALPGLALLSHLEVLCLRRNWFNALPSDIGELRALRKIDASRNFLKPNQESLRFDQLRSLPHFQALDVSLNQKCRTAEHREIIRKQLRPREVDVAVTVWQERSNLEHNCIGASAAERDPALLRSQLEPWGTVNLRRRLVRDFGTAPTDPVSVDRAGVMDLLLRCYRDEGLLRREAAGDEDLDPNLGVGDRRTIHVDGAPVRKELLDEILVELKDWRGNGKRGGSMKGRERPSIKAVCYMILHAPSASGGERNTSRRDKRREKKMEGNAKLWELALQALQETDPEFAARCSEIAVTYGFTGSPHIDRQNASPFYGLSLGEFAEGTGGISVECSPRIVANVNTKHRLGRVDGRYPHWVSRYDPKEDRFSLIYYDTLSAYQTPGPAIFKIP